MKMKKIIARFILGIFNIRIKKDLPDIRQYVLVLAPHTSYWDMPIGWAVGEIINAPKYKFMIKREAVQNFFYGWILKLMGAMPVDRYNKSAEKKSTTAEAINFLKNNPDHILIITPENTTKEMVPWSTGFGQVCRALNIPVVKGFIDYKENIFLFSESMYLTDNQSEDNMKIAKWYTDHSGGRYTPKFK
jgi:1-acyl-sn-glycerol-3-phosphate acyltransferase